MNSFQICNAKIVNEGRIIDADVFVKNGRIEKIGRPSYATKTHSIDLQGRYLVPGMIDDQVHFREPGLTHKATIASESRAAVAGGVTSFMEMPNTQPTTTNYGELDRKYQIAMQSSQCNFAFYFGATNDNLELVKALKTSQSAGVKVFMGSSTGNMLVNDQTTLEQIFKHAPTIIATHCEDDERILVNENQFKEHFGDNVPFNQHPHIRDRTACLNSSSFAVALAKKHQTPLNVLHITTKEEIDLFDQGAIEDKLITAEVCLPHLTLDDRDYDPLGSLIKCNPAIKTNADRQALVSALSLNKLDIIATDHAPHTWDEKQQTYFNAPSGMPSLQHAMPMALELVHDKYLTITEFVSKTAHNVASRYRVLQRGYIREGYWADLVAIDFNRPQSIRHEDSYSLCGWTPMHGRTIRSSIFATWVNGDLAYFDNQIIPVQGKRLDFGCQRY